MSNPQPGRVYRRCACRDTVGRQLGARCPKLAGGKHGRWTFAVDLPSPDGRRQTRRRGGFASRTEAQAALGKVLEYERTGIVTDDKQTVADYLTTWLRTKALTLKPTTVARYHDYVTKDLIPTLGTTRLDALSHHHVALFIGDQLAAGRGPVTLRRCVATLSSALTDAVRQRRLPHNPARYALVPRPPEYEPTCWSPIEAAKFLRYCHDHADPLADLYELIIGTGVRKGETLALHWHDIHLADHVAFIRHTLSNINHTTRSSPPPRPRTAAPGSASPTASSPPSIANDSANPDATSSSADATATHYDPNTCCTTSTTSPRRPDCPGVESTTCETSPPPPCSTHASHSP
ncbi:hypothetical protein GCM10027184_25100 [Saccharothrix stipae]